LILKARTEKFEWVLGRDLSDKEELQEKEEEKGNYNKNQERNKGKQNNSNTEEEKRKKGKIQIQITAQNKARENLIELTAGLPTQFKNFGRLADWVLKNSANYEFGKIEKKDFFGQC